jgi:hypothetical protein
MLGFARSGTGSLAAISPTSCRTQPISGREALHDGPSSD